MKKILITGVAGSGGSFLAEYIAHNHPEVELHGVSRWHATTVDNLQAIRDRITVHEADLMDFGSIFQVLRDVMPDAIFHIAAMANVKASFATPNSFLSNNVLGTSNLFEAVRLAGQDPLIQLCSTSEVYGQVAPEQVPIKEDCSFAPASPYAVSKVAQDLLGYTYFKAYKMRIVRTRMFTYLNPRRTDLFATAFAKQVAWIEAGLATELVHGNLDSVRTIVDVRDAMRAYWLALERGVPGEVYNIGGTTTLKVGEVLERLVGLATCPIPTRVGQHLLRPADVTLQIPNVDKFVAATGWRPQYTFEESLADLLAYWRRQAAQARQLAGKEA
jgi:GDP-mannose 4,6-dehydratase